MARVNPRLLLISDADSTTGWVGTSGGLDIEVYKQGSGAYTYQTGKNSIETATFTPATNINMTANYTTPHLYWTMRCDVFPFCELLNTGSTNSGLMLRVTDGSGNYTQWHVAGSDTWDGGWRNFVLDLTNTANIHSTSGTLSLADVDIISFITDNSNSGNIRIIDNTWVDSVRYGEGLEATSTTTEAVSFQDIADSDVLTTNYYGVIQETDGVLFCQGSLVLGENTDTYDTNFVSTNETVYFKDRIVDLDHYYIQGIGTTGATTSTDINITGLVTKTVGSSGAEIDFSDTNINSLVLDSCTFIDMGAIDIHLGSVASSTFNGCGVFSTTGSTTGVTITNTTFNTCDVIYPDTGTTFSNCTFTNSTATSTIITDTLATITDCTFESDGSNHGVEITTPGTYTFSGNTFSGYETGVSGSTGNEMIYNNSGGLVTINVVNGTTVSYRNGTSATTVVNNNVSITFSGLKDNTEVRVYYSGTTTELAGIENAIDGDPDDRSFTFSAGVGTVVDYRIHNLEYDIIEIYDYTIPNTSTTLPINQRFDRYYYNP